MDFHRSSLKNQREANDISWRSKALPAIIADLQKSVSPGLILMRICHKTVRKNLDIPPDSLYLSLPKPNL
jgi:hypothetical protein